jgi:hypothetical protein
MAAHAKAVPVTMLSYVVHSCEDVSARSAQICFFLWYNNTVGPAAWLAQAANTHVIKHALASMPVVLSMVMVEQQHCAAEKDITAS